MKMAYWMLFMLACSALAKDAAITFQASVEDQSYSIGEPVYMTLVFANHSSAERELNLGSEGIENIRLWITHEGTTRSVRGYIRDGVSRRISLLIPAGGVQTHGVFFQDFMQPRKPGLYEVSIQILDATVPPATVRFSIFPDTEEQNERLHARYSSYADRMQSDQTSASERNHIRNIIVKSRNTAGLELQRQILKERQWDEREFGAIVSAMIDMWANGGGQILIQEILDHPASTDQEKSFVLSALKIYGADEWEGERLRLVEPYLDKMEETMPGFKRSDHLLVRGEAFDMLIPKERAHTLGPDEWIIDE